MLKPVWGESREQDRRSRRQRRRLRTVAMLPTLLTLANLYCGFAAIYYCGRQMQDIGSQTPASQVLTRHSQRLEDLAPTYLSIAVWLLIGAMICDALDGRVARITGQASNFGEQLDSLADIVSFGVAPALLMVTLVHRELQGYAPLGFERFGQAAMVIGVVYVGCAALRLARFNVEATIDEAAHRGFKGLPSPGAAGGVASIVFLHDHLQNLQTATEWETTTTVLAKLMPISTLVIALLMVSRIQYVHAVSSLLRRRPFGHLVPILLVVPLCLLYTEFVAWFAAWGFVLSGPVRTLWRRINGTQEQETGPDQESDNEEIIEPTDDVEKQQIL